MKYEGYTVHDATKSVLLHIRPVDATSGQKDPATCAAAKSACRLPGVVEARVYRTRTYLLKKNKRGQKHWERYITPQALRGEMISFDRGSFFDPGDYSLRAPGKTAALGSQYNRYREHGSTGKKKPRSKAHVVKGIREHGPRGWPGNDKK
jgi:hypothetical protein